MIKLDNNHKSIFLGPLSLKSFGVICADKDPRPFKLKLSTFYALFRSMNHVAVDSGSERCVES